MEDACRPTNLTCAIVSALGVTAYYSELLKQFMPVWLAVGLLILPVSLIVLIVPGEAGDRVVGTTHLFAAVVMLLYGLGVEIGHWIGYRPPGVGFFRFLTHPGWTFAWSGILRRAWQERGKNARSNQ